MSDLDMLSERDQYEVIDEMQSWKPGEFFHGTSEEAFATIKTEGLVPGKGRGGDISFGGAFQEFNVGDRKMSVYLAKSAIDASFYADLAASVTGTSPVLLRVTFPRGSNAVRRDEQDPTNYRFVGSIPPDWIERVPRLTDNEAVDSVYLVILCKPGTANFNPNQPRKADGRFGSGGSSSGDDASSQETPAAAKAQGILARWGGKVDALINRVPVVGKVKRAVSSAMQAVQGRLASRYGDRAAKVIMASGSVGGYGVMTLSIKTLGFTLPFVTDAISIAAHVAVAEGLHQLGYLKGKAAVHNLDHEALGREAWQEIAAAVTSRLRSHVAALEDGLRGEDLRQWRLSPTTNETPDPTRLTAFAAWLRTQIDSVGLSDDQLWARYAAEGFRKGQARSWDDARGSGRGRAAADAGQRGLDFYDGTREQFLRSSFNSPVAVAKVKLLAGRSFDELKNCTHDMATRIQRTLTDGLVQGKNPKAIARDMTEQVEVSRKRALVISRTEISRAHASGQLQSLRDQGMGEVGVDVEWTTTGNPCPECAEHADEVFSVEDAEGLLPWHPNCLCCWTPNTKRALTGNAARKTPQTKGDDGRFAAGGSLAHLGKLKAAFPGATDDRLQSLHDRLSKGEMQVGFDWRVSGAALATPPRQPTAPTSSPTPVSASGGNVAVALHRLALQKRGYLVPVYELHDALGRPPLAQFHAELQRLRQAGLVEGQEHEGRHGITDRERETALVDPSSRSHGLGSKITSLWVADPDKLGRHLTANTEGQRRDEKGRFAAALGVAVAKYGPVLASSQQDGYTLRIHDGNPGRPGTPAMIDEDPRNIKGEGQQTIQAPNGNIVKAGGWLDWGELHYPTNYKELPKAERAQLEAEEQKKYGLRKNYKFHKQRQEPGHEIIIANLFCPTGEGGGIDATCTKGEATPTGVRLSSSMSSADVEVSKIRSALPSEEEVTQMTRDSWEEMVRKGWQEKNHEPSWIGTCRYVSMKVAERLEKAGIKATLVEGDHKAGYKYGISTHYFLVTKDHTIIDPTAVQFNGAKLGTVLVIPRGDERHRTYEYDHKEITNV